MNKKVAERIRTILWEILNNLSDDHRSLTLQDTEKEEIGLTVPKNRQFGDLSTNSAFKYFDLFNFTDHMQFAGAIVAKLNQKKYLQENIYTKAEVAGKGFINFFLSKNVNLQILQQILEEKENFGKSTVGKDMKILLEFVSANPTGPLTLAHGRQAAVGDVLASILSAAGYDVTREYYLNDRGRQMNVLAESVTARYSELTGEGAYPFPDEGYRGNYIYMIAREFMDTFGRKEINKQLITEIRSFSFSFIMDMIKRDLTDFGVNLDSIFSEYNFVKTGKVHECLEVLEQNGYVYESDDALWFKSTAFKDDKDRVLVKRNGEMTYITPDIAYHREKYRRGYKKLINLWGPDHHGYIPRLKAALKALGYDPDTLYVVIVQLCSLYRGKKKLSMSTRKGEFITLRDIIHTVGTDAARYFFITRKTDSHLDFDLELAKKKSADNPVYYIQYAHARICRVYEKLQKKGYDKELFSLENVPHDIILTEEEIMIIKHLSRYPDILITAARLYEPAKLTDYLYDVAQLFHQFYNRHRIITRSKQTTEFRILLIESVRIVLTNALDVLGIRAPSYM